MSPVYTPDPLSIMYFCSLLVRLVTFVSFLYGFFSNVTTGVHHVNMV